LAESLGAPLPPPPDAIGRWLFHVSRGFAAAGGLVLVVITLMSVASIASRFLTSRGLQGDFELVQLGCAVAVAAFLPWGQMRGSHVMVDFFTEGISQRAKSRLDALGALLLVLRRASLARAAAWGVALVPIVFNPANYYLHSMFLLVVLAAEHAGKTTLRGLGVWVTLLAMCVASYFTNLSTDIGLHFKLETFVCFTALGALFLLEVLRPREA